MANILFIPKSQEELEMIREFALRNGLRFTIVPDEQSATEPKPYISMDQAPPVAEEAAGIYRTEKTLNTKDMEKVIVDVTNENDLQYIEQVLSERGISFRKEYDTDFQQRLKARKLLAEASQNWPSYDISMDAISAMVKEARAERHAGKQDKNNH
jgi:superfamily I DNA/RNA helicase